MGIDAGCDVARAIRERLRVTNGNRRAEVAIGTSGQRVV